MKQIQFIRNEFNTFKVTVDGKAPKIDIDKLRDELKEYTDPEMLLIMDSKGLYDSLANDLPGDDKKSAMEVPIIEEFMEIAQARARWTPHNRNPADALTKFRGAHTEPLLTLVRTAFYILRDEAAELASRAAEKETKGYKARNKTTATGIVNAMKNFEEYFERLRGAQATAAAATAVFLATACPVRFSAK